MAITSISRIQHRRGLRTDLPVNLNEGELGWCIDTRELFIGNGKTYGGNTQILSAKGPNSDLITHTYKGPSTIPAQTGPSLTSPVSRTIGAVFDDWISVKDYGAIGDGVADDTDAINRAISDRWRTIENPPYADNMTLSAIRFPSGTYRITDSIKLYPFTTLLGDGPGASVIKMDVSSSSCVVKTVDNNGNVGVNIGQDGAMLPTNIAMIGLTIDNSSNPSADGVWLQRASNVFMSRVQITGAWQNYSVETAFNKALLLQTLSTSNLSNNITMVDMDISGYVYGLYCSDPIEQVTIDRSYIHGLWQGVTLGLSAVSNGPSYFKISNSQIKDIDDRGFSVLSSNPGITSTNNTYDTVGDWNNVNPIYFDAVTNSCSSVNDVFTRAETTKIYLGNPARNLMISAQQTSIAVNAPITIGPITLIDNVSNTPTGISYDTSIYNTVFVNYSVVRGSTRRAGTLTLITNGSTASMDDTYVNHGGLVGVDFSVTVSAGIMYLRYTTTSTGSNATMNYIETKWLA